MMKKTITFETIVPDTRYLNQTFQIKNKHGKIGKQSSLNHRRK